MSRHSPIHPFHGSDRKSKRERRRYIGCWRLEAARDRDDHVDAMRRDAEILITHSGRVCTYKPIFHHCLLITAIISKQSPCHSRTTPCCLSSQPLESRFWSPGSAPPYNGDEALLLNSTFNGNHDLIQQNMLKATNLLHGEQLYSLAAYRGLTNLLGS